jgi:hypothetical protein
MMQPMNRTKRLMLGCLSTAIVMLSSPARALAQDEGPEFYDARLEAYGAGMTLDSSSTALMWLLLVVLGAMCVGVMFKNAKRTHLD